MNAHGYNNINVNHRIDANRSTSNRDRANAVNNRNRMQANGEEIGARAILDALELGPVADLQTLYDRRHAQHVDRQARLAEIAVRAALPLLFVAGMQLPLKSILSIVLKTLI